MKVYRKKKRSCPLCKPNKTGGSPRFTAKELADRRQAEREINGTRTKQD